MPREGHVKCKEGRYSVFWFTVKGLHWPHGTFGSFNSLSRTEPPNLRGSFFLSFTHKGRSGQFGAHLVSRISLE